MDITHLAPDELEYELRLRNMRLPLRSQSVSPLRVRMEREAMGLIAKPSGIPPIQDLTIERQTCLEKAVAIQNLVEIATATKNQAELSWIKSRILHMLNRVRLLGIADPVLREEIGEIENALEQSLERVNQGLTEEEVAGAIALTTVELVHGQEFNEQGGVPVQAVGSVAIIEDDPLETTGKPPTRNGDSTIITTACPGSIVTTKPFTGTECDRVNGQERLFKDSGAIPKTKSQTSRPIGKNGPGDYNLLSPFTTRNRQPYDDRTSERKERRLSEYHSRRASPLRQTQISNNNIPIGGVPGTQLGSRRRERDTLRQVETEVPLERTIKRPSSNYVLFPTSEGLEFEERRSIPSWSGQSYPPVTNTIPNSVNQWSQERYSDYQVRMTKSRPSIPNVERSDKPTPHAHQAQVNYEAPGLRQSRETPLHRQSVNFIPAAQQLQEASNQTNRQRAGPVSSWQIRFDGSPNGLGVDDFLFRVETLARADGVPQSTLVYAIHQLLTGRASKWYWQFCRKVPRVNWAQLSYSLRREFEDQQSDHEIRLLMESRKQKPRERFNDFRMEIEGLALRLRQPMGGNELLQILRRNMHPALRKTLILKEFNNVDEMDRICRQIEKLWSDVGETADDQIRTRRYNVHELNQESSEYPGMHYVQNDVLEHCVRSADDASEELMEVRTPKHSPYIICWNCDDLGHTFKYCPVNTRRIFCFTCGAKNVLRPNCYRCVKGNSRAGQGQRGPQNPPATTITPQRRPSHTDRTTMTVNQRSDSTPPHSTR